MFFLSLTKPRKKTIQTPKPQLKQIGEISYIHKINAKSRSYKLKVDEKGQLIVVSPPRFNQQQLETFILANQGWIQIHRAKITSKKNHLETDESIMVLGKLYHKKIIVNPDVASFISLENDELHITVPEQTPAKIQKIIQRFLEQTAEQYIAARVDQLAKKMDTTFTKLRYGEHKTQWGSCHRNGTLTFNWRLIHAPRKVIDYVIIHELAHRTHHDHSHRFWNLVATFDEDFQAHRNWLTRYGVSAG